MTKLIQSLMNDRPFLPKHGIAAFHPSYPKHILHACLYEQPPGPNDIKSLTLELLQDREFGLTDVLPELIFRPLEDHEFEDLTVHPWESVKKVDPPPQRKH